MTIAAANGRERERESPSGEGRQDPYFLPEGNLDARPPQRSRRGEQSPFFGSHVSLSLSWTRSLERESKRGKKGAALHNFFARILKKTSITILLLLEHIQLGGVVGIFFSSLSLSPCKVRTRLISKPHRLKSFLLCHCADSPLSPLS